MRLIEDERFIELIELKFGQGLNGRKLGIEESFKIFFTFLGIGKLAVNAIPHKSSGEYMPVSGHASAFLSLTLKSAVMICGGINRARKRSANRDSEMSQCVLLSRFQLNEIRSSIFHTKFCVRSKERKRRDSSTNLTFYSKSNYPIDNFPSIETNFSIDSVSLVRVLFISITRLVTRCVSKQCS